MRGSVAEVGAAASGNGAGCRDEALTHGHVHALTERVAWEAKETGLLFRNNLKPFHSELVITWLAL